MGGFFSKGKKEEGVDSVKKIVHPDGYRMSQDEFKAQMADPQKIESIDWTKFKPEDVVAEELNFDWKKESNTAIVYKNILTQEECAELIKQTESDGYH